MKTLYEVIIRIDKEDEEPSTLDAVPRQVFANSEADARQIVLLGTTTPVGVKPDEITVLVRPFA